MDVCMISHFHDGEPYMQHTAHAKRAYHAAHAPHAPHVSYSDATRLAVQRSLMHCDVSLAQCFLMMGTTCHLRRQHKKRGRKRK